MKAAVLSIGTELTRGELVNTNATWLCERLTLLGFDVVEALVVDDDRARVGRAVRRLCEDVSVVVSTGGLGPTTDDLTTEAVAAVLGVPLERHAPSIEAIRARFASFGRTMSPSNEKQADFPTGASVLANPVGTAPGFRVSMMSAQAFFLPGVPSEMRRLFEEHVEPQIAGLVVRTSHQIKLRTFGLPESQVGEMLAGLEQDEPGLTLGYRASFPEIEVKVLVRASTFADAEARATRAAGKVRDRLGRAVFGEDEDTFAEYVGRTLRDRAMTVAVAESCTGGMIGQLLTSVPGSSDYLLLDAVTYSNASKTDVLGVSGELLRAYGAVSGEVAVAMAEGALRRSGADLAIAVTGVAGPGGGSDAKPVGTVWFALAARDKTTVCETRKLVGDRERIRTVASYLALKLVVDAAQGRTRD